MSDVGDGGHRVEDPGVGEPGYRAHARQVALAGLLEEAYQPFLMVAEHRLHVSADTTVVPLLREIFARRAIEVYECHGPPPGKKIGSLAPYLKGPSLHPVVERPRPCRERVCKCTMTPRYLSPSGGAMAWGALTPPGHSMLVTVNHTRPRCPVSICSVVQFSISGNGHWSIADFRVVLPKAMNIHVSKVG